MINISSISEKQSSQSFLCKIKCLQQLNIENIILKIMKYNNNVYIFINVFYTVEGYLRIDSIYPKTLRWTLPFNKKFV